MQPLRKRRGFRTSPSCFNGMSRAQEASAGCHPAFLGGSIAGLALVCLADQFYEHQPSALNAVLDFQRATPWLGYRRSERAEHSTRRGFILALKDGVSAPESR